MKNNINIFKILLIILLVVIFPNIVNAENDYYMIEKNTTVNPLSNMYVKTRWYQVTSNSFYETKENCDKAGGSWSGPEYRYYHSLKDYRITCVHATDVTLSQAAYLHDGFSESAAIKACSKLGYGMLYKKDSQHALACSNKDCQKNSTSYNGVAYCVFNEGGYDGCAVTIIPAIKKCTVGHTDTGISPKQLQTTEAVARKNGTGDPMWSFCISPAQKFPHGVKYEKVSLAQFNLTACGDKSSPNYDRFACGIAAIMLTAKDQNLYETGAPYAAIITALRLWVSSDKHTTHIDNDGVLIFDGTSEFQSNSPIYRTTSAKIDAGYTDYDREQSENDVIYGLTGNGIRKVGKAIELYKVAANNTYAFPTTITPEIETYKVGDLGDDGKFNFYIKTNFDPDKTTIKSINSNTSGVSLSLLKINNKYLNKCEDDGSKYCIKVEGYIESYDLDKYCSSNNVAYTLKISTKSANDINVSLLQSQTNPSYYQRFVVFEETSGASNEEKVDSSFTTEFSIECLPEPTDSPSEETEKERFVCAKPGIDYSGQVNSCEDGDNTIIDAETVKAGVIETTTQAQEWLSQKTSLDISVVSGEIDEKSIPTESDINDHRLTSKNFTTTSNVICQNKYCNVDITNVISSVTGNGKTPGNGGIWYIPVTFTVEYTLADNSKVSRTYYSVSYNYNDSIVSRINEGGGSYNSSYRVLINSNAFPEAVYNSSVKSAKVTNARPFKNITDCNNYVTSKTANELTYITGKALKELPTADEVVKSSLTKKYLSTSCSVDCGTKECEITFNNTYSGYGASGTRADTTKHYVNGSSAGSVWYTPVYCEVKFTFRGGATATKTYYSVGFSEQDVIHSNTNGKKKKHSYSYSIKITNIPEPEDYSSYDSTESTGTQGVVKDPTLECIINIEDLSEKYDFTDKYVKSSYPYNKYCSIKCRETVTYNFFGKEYSNTVNYLQYQNGNFLDRSGNNNYLLSNFEGDRECVSMINYQQWKEDWNKVNDDLILLWNEFKKYESVRINTTAVSVFTEDSNNGPCESNECPEECCGEKACPCESDGVDESGNPKQKCGTACCGAICNTAHGSHGAETASAYVWHWNDYVSGSKEKYAIMEKKGSTYTKSDSDNYQYVSNSDGSAASCDQCTPCDSGANCSGKSGNPNYYAESYAGAAKAYISKLNEREKLLAYIQDCNLYVNLYLHQGYTTSKTNTDDVYLLGVSSSGTTSAYSTSTCSASSSSCKAQQKWPSSIDGVTSRDYKDTIYYKITGGYDFSPTLSYKYDSAYNKDIVISNKNNTSYQNTQILYPENTYEKRSTNILPTSKNVYTLTSTYAGKVKTAEGATFCADDIVSGYIDYINDYPEYYGDESICTLDDLKAKNNTQKVDYWSCTGSGTSAKCENIKVTVPKNNIVKVKVKKKTNFYQIQEFYSTIPDGDISTTYLPNSIKLTYNNGKNNIFPLEMDRISGEYQASAKYKNVGDANRSSSIKFKDGSYTCPYIVNNEITICEPCGNGNGVYGFYFRTIDLKDPFPVDINVNSIWNTSEIQNTIVANMKEKGNDIYLGEPDYEFVITPQNIRNIKNYNKNKELWGGNGFNDFNLTCECTSAAACSCVSHFLNLLPDSNLVSSYKEGGSK